MKSLCVLFLSIFLLLSCGVDRNHGSSSDDTPQTENASLEFIVERSDVIWGMDFLPDQRIIFSERAGKILIFDPNTRTETEISGVPAVSTGGEGGLLDLKLHPSFQTNQKVYFCYTVSGRAMALGSGTLNGNALTNVTELFRTNSANNSSVHFGCRIEFQNNSQLFLSLGDQSEPSSAQLLTSHFGKILRLNDDGSAPADNPFVGAPNALPEIWSLGHRNPQGLALQPGTNILFSSEHGPTGGDELNVIERSFNYGWPLVTTGTPAGELGESAPGFTDPIASWTPSIAPSGMTFFNGSLFIATLRGQHIRRIILSGTVVTGQEILFPNEGLRFRNVRPGPDGFLYFSTDNGKIGRIIQ